VKCLDVFADVDRNHAFIWPKCAGFWLLSLVVVRHYY